MAVDLVIISVVFVVITAVSIAIRIYTRTVILKNTGVDDRESGRLIAMHCADAPQT